MVPKESLAAARSKSRYFKLTQFDLGVCQFGGHPNLFLGGVIFPPGYGFCVVPLQLRWTKDFVESLSQSWGLQP